MADQMISRTLLNLGAHRLRLRVKFVPRDFWIGVFFDKPKEQYDGAIAFVVKNCGTCQGNPKKCVKKCAYFKGSRG